MAQIRYLREDEAPSEGSWILIERTGPVWAANSASSGHDAVPFDPIGPFHTRQEAVAVATELAEKEGIAIVYVRGED